MLQLRIPILAYAALGAAAVAQAQVTVPWGGGFPNDNFSAATNWYGGVVPDSSDVVQFTNQSDSVLKLDVPVSVAGIDVTSSATQGSTTIDVGGGNTLTLGSAGVTAQADGVGDQSQINLKGPIVLAASQTWTVLANANGNIEADGPISDNSMGYGLTLLASSASGTFIFNSASSTFSGGVTVNGNGAVLEIGAGTLTSGSSITSGPLGTGTLLLGDGTTLTTANGGGPALTLANPITVGNNTTHHFVTFGGQGAQNSGPVALLDLTGPITLANSTTAIAIGTDSSITESGTLSGLNAGTTLVLEGANPSSPTPFSFAILQGAIANVSQIKLTNRASVILDGAGVSQISSVTGFQTPGARTYLGLGGGYAANSGVETFLSYLSTYGNPALFTGSIGFDTTAAGAGPNNFGNAVDLANFTSTNFVGLGSATNAVLSGPLTPPNGVMGTSYPFGGGGGTLQVLSALTDSTEGYFRDVSLSGGNAPLTLILSGALSYSGGTNVNAAALIFDTPLPLLGGLHLNGGYIGTTVNSGYTDPVDSGNIQSFINLFSGSGASGVIGFDDLTGNTRMIATNIDMSGLGSGLYLGSATAADYTGSLTPYGNTYQFAGVKGGQVTISSNLTDGVDLPNSVAVGLPSPIESLNPVTGSMSQSSVVLAGANSYTGGTVLHSGYLYVTNFNALGSGALTVPDPVNGSSGGWVATLAPYGGSVTVPNSIFVPDNGLALNTGGSNTLTLTGVIADYPNSGIPDHGQLGIFGPVVIDNANTYSGGTTIQQTTVTVNTDSGLGTGWISADHSTLTFTSASPALGTATSGTQVYFSTATANFSGNPSLYNLDLGGASVLNLNGTAAYIEGINDSSSGASVINLANGAVLTFDVNNTVGNASSFHGVIAGGEASSVSVINSDTQDGSNQLELHGANTYGGGTTIGSNALVIASNNLALGTGPVTIGSGGGLVTNTGVVIANALTLNDGGGLAGFGTFSPGGNLTFQNGSILLPGRGPIGGGNNGGASQVPITGTLTFGINPNSTLPTSLIFGDGGKYFFSLTDAAGAAGVGYSTVTLGAGALTINSTATPFTIAVYSFDPTTQAAGAPLDFNPYQGYTWTLLTANSISGFSPTDFIVDTSNLTPSISPGNFFVSEGLGDTSLLLNFTPVPEPSTWALMASGLFALGAAVRRRRR